MKEFLVVHFTISPLEPGRDILMAWLDQYGYDSFEETDAGLKAYIRETDFDPAVIDELPLWQQGDYEWSYQTEKLATINWNEEWERHYDPVRIKDRLLMRAPFHPAESGYQYSLLIEPKMSFGTGHHETTRLMATAMFEMDLAGKTVLDMGTGTGVLAILAEKMGAQRVTAIDNFEWAVTNTAENAERNDCIKVTALLGDAEALKNLEFQVILANINRNVLLADMKTYVASLEREGHLLMSGFFRQDAALIRAEAEKHQLKEVFAHQEGKWSCICFAKSSKRNL